MVFTARQESPDSPETKTELDGNHVLWSPGDVILVYNGEETTEFTTRISEPSAQVDFSGVFSSTSTAGTEYRALYGSGVFPSSAGEFVVSVPRNQVGAAYSFQPRAFPSVAHTKGTDLRFFNVCGGVGFTFTRNDIASVTIRSNGGEHIAGGALVAFSSENRPYVKNSNLAVEPGVSEVTMTAPYGTFVPGIPYYVSLLPCSLEKGLTIILRLSTEGMYSEINISKPLSIKRSVFGKLNGIDENLEILAEIPAVPDLIDLGLSVRWAEFNLGSTDPDEAGYYYAWGETEPKEDYSWSTYKWGTDGAFSRYSSYPSRLRKDDDAASVKMGSEWRMPTAAEIEELITGCNWKWVSSGSSRILVGTSKVNGAQIRFPLTGCFNETYLLYDTRMAIWSSDLYDEDSSYASDMQCIYSYGTPAVDSYRNPRCWGLNIRPVENVIPKINGHEYVDLDLPSGLKWAACNMGADSPEDYGDYYAWAETEPKESYGWDTYLWMDHNFNNWRHITKYTFDDGTFEGSWYKYHFNDLTGETTYEFFGDTGNGDAFTDLSQYGYSDDAARQNWGGSWRIPFPADFQELINNTDNEWTADYNGTGKTGYVFTSKTDATKSIFLPAAGYREGTTLVNVGSLGYYWSSSLSKSYVGSALRLYFKSVDVDVSGDLRRCGQSVRPVSE